MADETGITVYVSADTRQLMAGMSEGAEVVERSVEQMTTAFQGMERRLEHFGVAASFAMLSLANDSESGVSRALHALAMLGFAFGPLGGAISVALSLALEEIIKFGSKSSEEMEKARTKFTSEIEAMRRAGKGEDIESQVSLLKGDLAELESREARLAASTANARVRFDEMTATMAKHTPAVNHARDEWVSFDNQLKAVRDQIKVTQGELDIATSKLSNVRDVQLTDTQVEEFKNRAQEASRHASEVLQRAYEQDNRLAAAFAKTDKDERKKDAQVYENTWKEAHEGVALEAKGSAEAMAKSLRQSVETITRQIDEASRDWEHAFERINSSVIHTFEEMRRHGGTTGEFLRTVGRSVVDEFILGEVRKGEASAARWLAQNVGDTQAFALEIALSAKTAAIWIANEAAKAAASAWAAMEGVPYIGPVLAPAAAIAALAGVLALGSNIRSAAAGFDVPAGLNPVTQLHAQEMVLPAEYANVIRGLAGGGGAVNVHVHAMDAVDVARWASKPQNTRTLGDAALRHVRNGGTLPTAPGRRA